MLRVIVIIVGVVLAAIGGVIAFRAYFEPASAVIISSQGVQELPDTFRLVEGVVLFIVGAALAFTTAVRRARR